MYNPKTVGEAAILLDEIKPGWHDQIDVNKLNQNLCDKCILGQLYGGYWNAVGLIKHDEYGPLALVKSH